MPVKTHQPHGSEPEARTPVCGTCQHTRASPFRYKRSLSFVSWKTLVHKEGN